MRPVVIGVGGSHSGAGKTFVASLILRSFPGWGAIKCSGSSLYASIIDDLAVLSEEGKDTRKFLDAGAGKVIWVKSPYSEMGEVLPLAVGMVSHLPGVIIEGNSAIEIVKPDIVIFVAGSKGGMKETAGKILRMADVVISQSSAALGIPRRAILFERDKTDELMRYLSERVKGFNKNFA